MIKLLSALGVSPMLYSTLIEDSFAGTKIDPSTNLLSNRMQTLVTQPSSLGKYFRKSSYFRGVHAPGAIDLTFGNPHELPLPSIIKELQEQLDPKNADWFAYKRNEKPGRIAVAESLSASSRVEFSADDIFLTNGATAGIAMVLTSIVDPGDEVIYFDPPWFGYQPLITSAGGVPKALSLTSDFSLDLNKLESTINSKTRAVIVNSPHNPSGRVFGKEQLKALGNLLRKKSKEIDRPIALISDESYRRIIFDNKSFNSPTQYYDFSFLIYTYGKTLLMPGQRLGYVALSPNMKNQKLIRKAMGQAQVVTGWCYPNALLQYALPELEKLSIDMKQLQVRRDRVVNELSKFGYSVINPQGTFYVLTKSPITDDFEFTEKLAKHGVFVLPGETLGAPGYFRITLTATDDMLERALPKFSKVI